MTDIRITQITDLHLGATEAETLGGVRTDDSFLSVLQDAGHRGRADDLLLLTGDLASNCQPQAYRRLNQVLTENNRRAVWLPGNHDDVDLMIQELSNYPRVRVLDLNTWGILLIDSSQPGKPGGRVLEDELLLAQQGLEQLSGKHVLVAMHHSPALLDSAWLDKQRIENQQQLYDILAAHDGVKAVVTGHVHQEFDGRWGDFALYSTPSSCVQFKKYSDDFALSDNPPGYRWFDLYADGSIATGIQYLKGFAQRPNRSCVGY